VIPRQLLFGVAAMLVVVLAMGIYLWRMRSRVSQVPASAADTRPVAPPASGPTEPVTLFIAYDDPGILRPRVARIPLPSDRQQRAEELLRSLVNLYLDKSSTHPLPPGSEIRNVYLVEPSMAVIDANSALADHHRSGILVEELTVASLIQSLTANIPGITRVKLLVDGKSRDTLAGHADLSAFYDTYTVSRMVTQLSQ
jgi:hypothetical protein